MGAPSWSHTGVVVAAALLATVGVTSAAHSQSAGSIGVRVQVTSVEPARAAWAAAAEALALRGDADEALLASQPGPGKPALVVIDQVRGEPLWRPRGVPPPTRVSIVFP